MKMYGTVSHDIFQVNSGINPKVMILRRGSQHSLTLQVPVVKAYRAISITSTILCCLVTSGSVF